MKLLLTMSLIETHKSRWDLKSILNVPLNVPLNETYKTTWRGLKCIQVLRQPYKKGRLQNPIFFYAHDWHVVISCTTRAILHWMTYQNQSKLKIVLIISWWNWNEFLKKVDQDFKNNFKFKKCWSFLKKPPKIQPIESQHWWKIPQPYALFDNCISLVHIFFQSLLFI